MKVNGLHGDEGVPVEHDSATGVMSHAKVVREGLVLKVLYRRFLKSNHVPCSRNVFCTVTSVWFKKSDTSRKSTVQGSRKLQEGQRQRQYK